MTRSSPSCLWIKLISSFTATNILQISVPQESSIRPHHLDLLVTRGNSPRSAVNPIVWLSGCWLHDPPCEQILLLHAYWWYSAMIISYMYHVSFPIISFDMRVEVTKFIYIYGSHQYQWRRTTQPKFILYDAWTSNLDCHDCLSARLPAVPTLPVGTKNPEIILQVEIISLSIFHRLSHQPFYKSNPEDWTPCLPACHGFFPFSPHNALIPSYNSSHHASPRLINIKAHTSLPTHAHKQLIFLLHWTSNCCFEGIWVFFWFARFS